MKRIHRSAALLLALLILGGCSLPKHPGNKISFYYSRSEYAYGQDDAVIVAEKRDISGHEGDIRYILSLYLMGPLEEELTALFPATTRLLQYSVDGKTLTVELTDTGKHLSDAEFTLACSCLTMTCLELTDCTEVILISGEENVSFSASDLLLTDDPDPTEIQTEETQ